jgi:hypothetical protein
MVAVTKPNADQQTGVHGFHRNYQGGDGPKERPETRPGIRIVSNCPLDCRATPPRYRMEPFLPEMNKTEKKLTLLVVLVELVEVTRFSQLPLFLLGRRDIGTYGELFILGWLNRAVLRQTLNDGHGAVEFRLASHCQDEPMMKSEINGCRWVWGRGRAFISLLLTWSGRDEIVTTASVTRHPCFATVTPTLHAVDRPTN